MKYDGVAAAELAQRLRTPSCVSLVRVTSTLDVVHQLAGDGAPARTVVLADEQVAGRGRHGKKWWSPAGVGIWLGYLFRATSGVEGGLLSLRVGMAVREALIDLGATPQLKWPNDVLLEKRKVAGILCESKWNGSERSWTAIGIGLNVRGPLSDDIAQSGIALDACVPAVTRIAVLERLVPRLHALKTAPLLSADEQRAFESADTLCGQMVREPVCGTVEGVDRDGALLVATAWGTERVVGGSVVVA